MLRTTYIHKNNNEFDKRLFNFTDKKVQEAIYQNSFFDFENIINCLNYWAKHLNEINLKKLVAKDKTENSKNILIIMAGNIPLVGFHDFLCVFLSGNKSDIKLSKKDSHLFTFIYSFLKEHSSDIKEYVEINDSISQDYDAVIATGNDLSANRFKKY